MKIKYSTNNSGGRWWLKDKDWIALKAAGWEVEDYDFVCREHDERLRKEPEEAAKWDFRRWWSKGEDGQMRYMGALAKEATKQFETPADAMREFEKLTGQDVSNEGCNCCGAPHTFYWGRAVDGQDGEWGSASGEACLEYLYDRVPGSLREAAEELSRRKP